LSFTKAMTLATNAEEHEHVDHPSSAVHADRRLTKKERRAIQIMQRAVPKPPRQPRIAWPDQMQPVVQPNGGENSLEAVQGQAGI
jgi:hypothetical protein